MMKVQRVDVYNAVSINKNMYQSFNSDRFDIELHDDVFYVVEKHSNLFACFSTTNTPFWVPHEKDFDAVFKKRVVAEKDSRHVQPTLQSLTESVEAGAQVESIRQAEKFSGRLGKTKTGSLQ